MNDASKIIEVLNRTANLLKNAGNGEKEKLVEVSFTRKENTVLIDAKKFTNESGEIVLNNKAIQEEQGRLLLKSELEKSFTKEQREQLSKEMPEVQSLTKGLYLKNAIEKVKSDWLGFSEEVDSCLNANQKPISITKKSSTDEKMQAIIQDWIFGDKSNVDFGDSKLANHRKDIHKILDELAEEIKPKISSDDCNISASGIEKLREFFDEGDEPSDDEGDEPSDDEGDEPSDDEGDESSDDEGDEPSDDEGDESSDDEGDEPSDDEGDESSDDEGDESSDDEGDEPSDKESKEDIFESITKEPEPLEKDPSEKESFKPSFKMKTVIHSEFYTKAKPFYKRIVLSRNRQIAVLQNAFAFRNNRLDRHVHGYKSGDLDLNGLHKLAMGDISVFNIKESPKNKRVTIGILLDQSASMRFIPDTATGKSRIQIAREIVIVLAEAIKPIKGVDLVIYGHTADMDNCHDLDLYPYLDNSCGMNHLEQLSVANDKQENADGFAIKYIADRMLANNPVSKDSLHCLFVMTDGIPSANGYRKDNAKSHTLSCVNEVIKRGQKVFAIGIDNAFDDKTGQEIFGDGNFVVIKDIESSVQILAREIKKLFSK